jgi:hypothetical protein
MSVSFEDRPIRNPPKNYCDQNQAEKGDEGDGQRPVVSDDDRHKTATAREALHSTAASGLT